MVGEDIVGVKVKGCNFSGLTEVSFAVDGRNHTFEDCDVVGTVDNAFVFAATSESCRLDGCSALGIGTFDEILEVIRRDRNWNEGAARKQLLTLFEALGHADPAVQAGRRKLSSLLFS